jgi:hypothetical protein
LAEVTDLKAMMWEVTEFWLLRQKTKIQEPIVRLAELLADSGHAGLHTSVWISSRSGPVRTFTPAACAGEPIPGFAKLKAMTVAK